MSWTLVQVASATHDSGAGTITFLDATFPANVTPGNVIVTWVWGGYGSGSTLSSVKLRASGADTDTIAQVDTQPDGSTSNLATWWQGWKPQITGAGNVIRANISSSDDYWRIWSAEYSPPAGAGQAVTLDSHVITDDISTNWNNTGTTDGCSQALTTIADGLLVVAGVFQTSDSNTPAVGTGWSNIIGTSEGAGDGFRAEYKEQATHGSITATWTYTGSATGAKRGMMALLPAGGATTPIADERRHIPRGFRNRTPWQFFNRTQQQSFSAEVPRADITGTAQEIRHMPREWMNRIPWLRRTVRQGDIVAPNDNMLATVSIQFGGSASFDNSIGTLQSTSAITFAGSASVTFTGSPDTGAERRHVPFGWRNRTPWRQGAPRADIVVVTAPNDMSATASIQFGGSASFANSIGTLAATAPIQFAAAADVANSIGTLQSTSAITFSAVVALTDGSTAPVAGEVRHVPFGWRNRMPWRFRAPPEGVQPPSANDMAAIASIQFGGSASTANSVGTLAASAAIQFAGTASTDNSIGRLQATAPIQFGATATLQWLAPIAATSAIQFASTASLTGIGRLQAQSAIQFGATVQVSGIGSLAATVAISFAGAALLLDANTGTLRPIDLPFVVSGTVRRDVQSGTLRDVISGTVRRRVDSSAD